MSDPVEVLREALPHGSNCAEECHCESSAALEAIAQLEQENTRYREALERIVATTHPAETAYSLALTALQPENPEKGEADG